MERVARETTVHTCGSRLDAGDDGRVVGCSDPSIAAVAATHMHLHTLNVQFSLIVFFAFSAASPSSSPGLEASPKMHRRYPAAPGLRARPTSAASPFSEQHAPP